MNVPEKLKYTSDHEWLKIADGEMIDGKQVGYVGITDFAQQELGDIVFIEIETVGEDKKQGEAFGAVEAVKTVSDLFMPVSGKILEKNPALDEEPELVNRDPYGDGWMIKVVIDDIAQLDELFDAAAYTGKISN